MQSYRRQVGVLDHLDEVDQFQGLKRAQLRVVERFAEQVQVSEGEILVDEGKFGKEFFLIVSGTAEVTHHDRPLNTLGPGDFFGELGALSRGTRNATVTARSNLDLLVIGQRESNAMLQIPQFRSALLGRMARRLQNVDAQLATAISGQTV